MQTLLAWCVATDLAARTRLECTSWAGALSLLAGDEVATMSDQLQPVDSSATD
jgi:hypothetical protein